MITISKVCTGVEVAHITGYTGFPEIKYPPIFMDNMEYNNVYSMYIICSNNRLSN